MVYHETDDLIGLGDFSKVIGKIGKIVRRVKGSLKRGKKQVRSLSASVRPVRVESIPAAPVSRGGGVIEFIKRNPIPVAAAALVGVFLFARK